MKLLLSQQLLEIIFPPLLFLVDSSEDVIPLTPSSAFILLLGTTHTAAKEPVPLMHPAWKLEAAWLLPTASTSQVCAGEGMRADSTLGMGARTPAAETSGFCHLWN